MIFPKNRCVSVSGKSIFFFVFAAVMVLVLLSGREVRSGEVVDRIVAVVNEDIIRLSDVEREFEPRKMQIRSRGLSPEEEEKEIYEARRQLIDDMIDDKLADQAMQEAGIRASENEVDATIERIKETNRLTREDLRRALQARGLSMEEYRENVRQQVMRNKLISREVRSRVVVTEDDIQEHYEEHAEKFGVTGKYRLKNIYMPYGEDRERVRKKMESVLDALESGACFSEMAKEHSMGPNARDGGRLGSFALEDLSDFLQPLMADLEAGDFTGIIETPIGFQIFFLEEHEKPADQEIQDVKKQIEEELYEQKVKHKFEEWIGSLRESAHIRVIL